MSAFSPFFEWLQTTSVPTAISQSSSLTGLISATHLLGLTLVVGGALVSGLRMMGLLLPERPASEIAGSAANGISLGLAISVTTGLLLFSARAATAAGNDIFQIKMILLLTAAAFHFAIYRRAARQDNTGAALRRLAGFFAVALWLGVAVAGCLFILFE